MANLLIVDDHPLFLDGLQQFLETNDHKILCCARSVSDALYKLQTEVPDVVILDLSMKDGGGLKILSSLRENGNGVPVIFLTVSIKPEETIEALQLGVNGIVLKESDPEELLSCIAVVNGGGNRIDPAIMEKALLHSVVTKNRTTSHDVLTEREKEIAKLIRAGLRNKVIAEKCGLTEGTVKVHLHSIFQKLGVKSRAELIVSSMGEPQ
ncbi:response regulator [Rhizorhapis sp. SPR117]|uniref:response regulator n=1 Tax=Rhizorhapis sp. SPR117 TaxID=2912611 RepID=UPI001F394D16|nr:response regulator transcription factor [Rhizorhapis sp. SPR117]